MNKSDVLLEGLKANPPRKEVIPVCPDCGKVVELVVINTYIPDTMMVNGSRFHFYCYDCGDNVATTYEMAREQDEAGVGENPDTSELCLKAAAAVIEQAFKALERH